MIIVALHIMIITFKYCIGTAYTYRFDKRRRVSGKHGTACIHYVEAAVQTFRSFKPSGAINFVPPLLVCVFILVQINQVDSPQYIGSID